MQHSSTQERVAVHACKRVCVLRRERSWVFASTALVVLAAWMAMYLTGYSDCLTSFREPLSLPWRCHTGLKNVWCDHCLRYCWVLDGQGEGHLKNGLNVQIPRVLGIYCFVLFLVSNFIWYFDSTVVSKHF